MRIVLSGMLVVVIGALVARLALAPYHQVLTADECRAAYAGARSHADSVAVSFKPFDDGDNAVDRRCATVLTVREISAAEFRR